MEVQLPHNILQQQLQQNSTNQQISDLHTLQFYQLTIQFIVFLLLSCFVAAKIESGKRDKFLSITIGFMNLGMLVKMCVWDVQYINYQNTDPDNKLDEEEYVIYQGLASDLQTSMFSIIISILVFKAVSVFTL